MEFTAERLKGFSFSDDGSVVRIFLSPPVADTPDVVLTMPVGQVEEFWAHLGNVVDSIRAANGGKIAPAPPQMVASWQVGGNSMMPNFVAIMFDQGKPSERIMLMPDLAALQMADAIEQKVLAGMSVEDQRVMMKEVEKARPGPPTKPRLIGIPPKGDRH